MLADVASLIEHLPEQRLRQDEGSGASPPLKTHRFS